MATRKSWEDMSKLGRAARARRQAPPPTWDPAEDYPDYAPHPTEDGTAGVDRGLMSDRFYDMLDRQGDPSRQLASSQFANRDYNVRAGQGRASTYDAQQRAVGEGELSAHQLDQMLASGSPLMRRAAAQGRATAAGRGLMNSAMAAGMAQGAMIDRAQPFALQDAAAYGRTASENMAAENLARKTGAELMTQTSLENARLRTQAGIAGMEAGAARDRVGMEIEGRGWDTIRQAMINIENREDTQAWQTAERMGTQEYQSIENELNRTWTSDENELNRIRDMQATYMQAYLNQQATREQAMMGVLNAIYSNPSGKLKAHEMNAAASEAIRKMEAAFGFKLNDNDLANLGLPQEVIDTVTGNYPAGQDTGKTANSGATTPVGTTPPTNEDGSYDYTAPPPMYDNPVLRGYWNALNPTQQQAAWENTMVGQSVASNTNGASTDVDTGTGPV